LGMVYSLKIKILCRVDKAARIHQGRIPIFIVINKIIFLVPRSQTLFGNACPDALRRISAPPNLPAR